MENNQEQPIIEPVAAVDQPIKKPASGALWLLVIVIVVIAALAFFSKKPMTDVTTAPDAETQTLCYYSSTPTESGFSDNYSLRLVLNGADATGELATRPAEKDSMSGTLVGTVMSNGEEMIFDGKYMNNAEGMNNVDQRLIKLSDTDARIGYGETVQNADGSYSYKDPSTVNYSLSIPRVDCAVYDQAMTLRS